MAAHMSDRGPSRGEILTGVVEQAGRDLLLVITRNRFQLADDSDRAIQVVQLIRDRETGVCESEWLGTFARVVDRQKQSQAVEVLLGKDMLLQQVRVHP